MAPAWTLEKGRVWMCMCVRAGVPGTSSSNSPASLLSSPWLEEASLLGVSSSVVTLPPASSSCSGSLSLGEVEWNAAGPGVTSWLCGPARPFPSRGFAFLICKMVSILSSLALWLDTAHNCDCPLSFSLFKVLRLQPRRLGHCSPRPPGGRSALLALVARAAARGPISGPPRPGDRSFPFLWWFSADRWTSIYQFPVFICLLPRWRLGKVLL